MTTAEHQGGRPTMEDAHVAKWFDGNRVGIFGVFDGHGGAAVAKKMGAEAADTIFAHLRDQRMPGQKLEDLPPEAVYWALRDAFARPPERAHGGSAPPGKRAPSPSTRLTLQDLVAREKTAGATAVVAVVLGKALYVAHLGDARAVVLGPEHFARLTADHKPLMPRERAKVEKRGEKVIEMGPMKGRLTGSLINVARALGDRGAAVGHRPDVTRIALDGQHDVLVLGCDGIFDSVHEAQLQELAGELRRRAGGRLTADGLHQLTQLALAGADQRGVPPRNRPNLDNKTIMTLDLAALTRAP